MYVVSYDITSDRLRNKIAKILEGYGLRVQYSVFECHLTEKEYTELYRKLMKLMENVEEGNIRFYPICGTCEKKIRTIGQPNVEIQMLKEEVIVVWSEGDDNCGII